MNSADQDCKDKDIGSNKKGGNFLVLHTSICLAPLALLLLSLLWYPYLISGGLAMRIVAAGLLAKGELPYEDFWDWSQPIVFELLKWLTLLCTSLASLGVAVIPASFIPLCIFALILGSLILLAVIAGQALSSADSAESREPIQDFALASGFSLALTTLIARFDFGELQYVLMLAVVPWLYSRWLAHSLAQSQTSGVKIAHSAKVVSRLLEVLTGCGAGVVACFDLPYVFVFIIVELALLLQSQRWRSLISLQWLTFVSIIAVNFIYLATLPEPVHTAFWQWTMPLKWLNYSTIDPEIVAPLSSPNRVDIIYCLVVAGFIAFLLSKRYNCFAPLTALMLSGLGLYMLEGQGFSHDFTLAIFAITTIFVSAVVIAIRRATNWLTRRRAEANLPARLPSPVLVQSIIVALAVTAATIVWQSLEHDRSRLQDYLSANITKGNLPLDIALERTSKVNDSVTLLSPYIEPAYPLLLFSGRKPGGYLLWSRPLWIFKWISDNSSITGPMKDFQAHTWSNIESEIAQHRTDLFIASDDKVLTTFDREKFFHALRKGYREVDTTGDYFSLGNHQPHEFCGFNPQFRFFVKRSERGQ
jgi:hypothetical protein